MSFYYFKCTPGASTALLGKECAMACTVAVEESISEHYNSQIRALMEKDPERYIELLQVSLAFHFTITFIDSPPPSPNNVQHVKCDKT